MKEVYDKFHKSHEAKNTMSRDPEFSSRSNGKKQMTLDGKVKNKLSKRDSVYFKPTEKDNKVLGDLILKVANIQIESTRKTKIQDKHHPL